MVDVACFFFDPFAIVINFYILMINDNQCFHTLKYEPSNLGMSLLFHFIDATKFTNF
jgi:hypothetical protein